MVEVGGRLVWRVAHRCRQPLGQLGGELDLTDHRQGAGDPAEYRRLTAQWRIRRRAWAADDLDLPYSYPGCSQHAPDEHILLPVTEEALAIMAGLFWDLGEMPRKT